MQGGNLRLHLGEDASALCAGKEFGNWGFGEAIGTMHKFEYFPRVYGVCVQYMV
jgi:hypothetical protein